MLGKEELLSALWTDSFVEEGNLTRNISTLRAALGEVANDRRYIETVPKRGYRFIADVREVQNGDAKLLVEESHREFVTPTEAQLSSKFAIENVRRSINSLAILPLVNDSADTSSEYLSDGITESIINNLSQLSELRVVSRSSAFRYKAKKVDLQTVGEELSVQAVVTGRVRQLGDTLIIAAELMDVVHDAQLWGQHYNRKISDVFKVQEEIAREICQNLRLQLNREEGKRLSKRHTKTQAAYQLYLKGRYFWNKRTRDGFTKAIHCFLEAIQKDPSYSLAYAGLADCYFHQGFLKLLSPKDSILKARATAITALQMDDTLAEAHVCLALILLFYDWDWSNAEKEFKRAIELNPNYAKARSSYADYFLMGGHLDRAISETILALELDPLSLIVHAKLGVLFYFARQYDQAIEQFRKTIEMDQNFYPVYLIGLPYEQKRMYSEAIVEFEKASSQFSDGDPEILACLGHAYAICGLTAEAQKILSDLSRQIYVESYDMAVIYAGLRKVDQAFEWLEKAYRNKDTAMLLIRVDPRLDLLRSDPRFENLLTKMILPA
jgi:TolB-like protein/Tfp pilus assembly protein PilF